MLVQRVTLPASQAEKGANKMITKTQNVDISPSCSAFDC
jgi:hypothetical protein